VCGLAALYETTLDETTLDETTLDETTLDETTLDVALTRYVQPLDYSEI
jgi:hypothetical protein